MKKFWEDMAAAVVMGLILPAVVLGMVSSIRSMIKPPQEYAQQTQPTEATAPQSMVCVLSEDEKVIELPMNTYLTSVLLAEMPVSFEDEALKAQSVVARTYTLRAQERASKHDGAAVCTNSACCQGYLAEEDFLSRGGKAEDLQRIRDLVASTSGQVLTYEGELIEATYFSCSGGATEEAVAVWGTDVPYLQSVPSPGEEYATHYTDTVTFSSAEFATKLDAELSGNPSDWFGQVTYTKGGGIAQLEIGGKTYTGTELRRLLGLRSTAFEIESTEDTITLTTHGYGHRVGMSQFGADAMAAAGSLYPEILAHYYQGTELTQRTD